MGPPSAHSCSPNGQPRAKYNWQGYNDASTWSRGQAWAVYGFAQAYEATGDPLYLQTAKKAADLFLKRLPADQVPAWCVGGRVGQNVHWGWKADQRC